MEHKGELMSGGYMGKILFVDLSTGSINEEPLEDQMSRNFIGGYGIGARILYSRQIAKVDPLGQKNTLGLITGPLTGTLVPTGTRYTVVAKSPLTYGWGDSNSGGDFGPYLKFAGFDAVFFTGISPRPIYLLIDNGKAQIRDGGDLWGKNTYETEDTLAAEYGSQSRSACIGPAGEKLSLIAGIMTNHGSMAARSGLGAVMGSKKLKAVVVRGDLSVPINDKAKAENIKIEQIKAWQDSGTTGISPWNRLHKYGTSYAIYNSAHSGDSPVKNWCGVGVIDMPDRAGLHYDVFAGYVEKGKGCWHCPLRCKAILKASTGEYKFSAGSHRPEYETAAAFGTNCVNNNIESILMVNDICNRAGIDTISCGSVIGFAIELYENGILTSKDLDGLDLRWGNHRAIVALTNKLANREGIGDILADGVKMATEKIGKGSEKYAIHVGGQEPGMHDPKITVGFPMAAARYQMDATPGRHLAYFGPSGFLNMHIVNASGLCAIGHWPDSRERMIGIINAITGWNYSLDDFLKIGERIATLRHSFNLREGINELNWSVHPRMIGNPPQSEGPLAGITADINAQVYWNLGALDWDKVTTKPSKAKLNYLGLDDIANDMWP
jgi:aldehyde:ferredoxin oxidoreductase